MSLNDLEKQEVIIWLEEYRNLRAEIVQRITLKAQIAGVGGTVTAAFLAAVAALSNTQKDETTVVYWLLLGAPWFIFALSMWLAAMDNMITTIGGYIFERITPRLNEIMEPNFVLQWDEYRMASEKKLRCGVLFAIFPHIFFLAISVTSMIFLINRPVLHLTRAQPFVRDLDFALILGQAAVMIMLALHQRQLWRQANSAKPKQISLSRGVPRAKTEHKSNAERIAR